MRKNDSLDEVNGNLSTVEILEEDEKLKPNRRQL
jgi:hypothetical protein